MKKNNLLFILLVFLSVCAGGCDDKYTYEVPEGRTELYNDCLKRSLGPNIAGQEIEFVYAMSMGPEKGKLVSVQTIATIAGSKGTFMENRSFHTDMSGMDVPVMIANPSVTIGNKTEIIFTKDTCAAALRYYYVIPQEARGKSVSFMFSATASTGKTVSYNLGPYQISKMDMKLDIVLSDNNECYLSIEDMAAYNATEAAANTSKIDLVYFYRSRENVNHSLVSPANEEYLSDITLPTGLDNNTPFWRVYGLRDRHLSRLQYGVYIDDIDFQKMTFKNAPNYGLDMKLESGAWVETTDGKYRAFIFVNKVDGTKREMTVSIKRYQMK